MMKILLVSINAKYIHTNNAVRLLKVNSSFNPEIFEYTIKDDINQIVKDIEDYNPDVIGCSIYIWNVNIFKELINKLSLQDSKIIFGGPEVSYAPEYFLTNTKADFIIKGEGEIAFESLANALYREEDYSEIPSLSFRKEGKFYHNPIKEVKDLSKIKLFWIFCLLEI